MKRPWRAPWKTKIANALKTSAARCQPRNRWRQEAAVVSFLLAAGCVSVPVSPPVELGPDYQGYFAACHPSDGSLRFEWGRAGGEQVGPLEFDWLAKAADDWQMQMFDPLGRIVFELTSTKQEGFSSRGSMARKLPALGRNEEGYLQAGGFAVGLRGEELPCLLASHFPRGWLKLLRRKEVGGEEAVFYGGDERRKLRLSFARRRKDGQPDELLGCARIVWEQLWGLQSNQLTWCIEERGSASSLQLPKAYSLYWMHNDG